MNNIDTVAHMNMHYTQYWAHWAQFIDAQLCHIAPVAQDRLARVIPSMHVHLCVALWLISLHPSPVFYFVPPFSFQPFLMFTSEFNERSRSNPLCDFRLGTVVTSDHETPLTEERLVNNNNNKTPNTQQHNTRKRFGQKWVGQNWIGQSRPQPTPAGSSSVASHKLRWQMMQVTGVKLTWHTSDRKITKPIAGTWALRYQWILRRKLTWRTASGTSAETSRKISRPSWRNSPAGRGEPQRVADEQEKTMLTPELGWRAHQRRTQERNDNHGDTQTRKKPDTCEARRFQPGPAEMWGTRRGTWSMHFTKRHGQRKGCGPGLFAGLHREGWRPSCAEPTQRHQARRCHRNEPKWPWRCGVASPASGNESVMRWWKRPFWFSKKIYATFSSNWTFPYQGGCSQVLISSRKFDSSICDWKNNFPIFFGKYHLFWHGVFSSTTPQSLQPNVTHTQSVNQTEWSVLKKMVSQNVFHRTSSQQIKDVEYFADRCNILWNLPTKFHLDPIATILQRCILFLHALLFQQCHLFLICMVWTCNDSKKDLHKLCQVQRNCQCKWLSVSSRVPGTFASFSGFLVKFLFCTDMTGSIGWPSPAPRLLIDDCFEIHNFHWDLVICCDQVTKIFCTRYGSAIASSLWQISQFRSCLPKSSRLLNVGSKDTSWEGLACEFLCSGTL